MRRLKDRVALVTGAVGGIGSAVVADFLQEGARVILCDVRGDAVAQTVARLQAEGHAVRGAVADIVDFTALKSAVEPCSSALGPVEIVVANASIGGRTPSLARTTPESWRDDVGRNLGGQYNTLAVALDGMKDLGRGAVVFVGSVNGLTALGQPAYSAAKAGLISLARTVASECGAFGIRANVVCPATVETPAWTTRLERDPELLKRLTKWYPLGRIARPVDVAKAVTFLSSDDAAFISGAMLPIDGGLLSGNTAMADELTRHNQ